MKPLENKENIAKIKGKII